MLAQDTDRNLLTHVPPHPLCLTLPPANGSAGTTLTIVGLMVGLARRFS